MRLLDVGERLNDVARRPSNFVLHPPDMFPLVGHGTVDAPFEARLGCRLEAFQHWKLCQNGGKNQPNSGS